MSRLAEVLDGLDLNSDATREVYRSMFASLTPAQRQTDQMLRQTLIALDKQLATVTPDSEQEQRQVEREEARTQKRRLDVVLACLVALTDQRRQQIAVKGTLPEFVLNEAIDVLGQLPVAETPKGAPRPATAPPPPPGPSAITRDITALETQYHLNKNCYEWTTVLPDLARKKARQLQQSSFDDAHRFALLLGNEGTPHGLAMVTAGTALQFELAASVAFESLLTWYSAAPPRRVAVLMYTWNRTSTSHIQSFDLSAGWRAKHAEVGLKEAATPQFALRRLCDAMTSEEKGRFQHVLAGLLAIVGWFQPWSESCDHKLPRSEFDVARVLALLVGIPRFRPILRACENFHPR